MSHLHKVTAGCTCCFISCCAYGCTHFTHMHRKSTEVVVQSQNEVPALVPFCIFPHFSILLKLPLLFYPELMKKLLQISLLTQNIHNFGVAEVLYSAGFFFPSQKQNFKNESNFIKRDQTTFLGLLLVVWRRIFWLWPFLSYIHKS